MVDTQSQYSINESVQLLSPKPLESMGRQSYNSYDEMSIPPWRQQHKTQYSALQQQISPYESSNLVGILNMRIQATLSRQAMANTQCNCLSLKHYKYSIQFNNYVIANM